MPIIWRKLDKAAYDQQLMLFDYAGFTLILFMQNKCLIHLFITTYDRSRGISANANRIFTRDLALRRCFGWYFARRNH